MGVSPMRLEYHGPDHATMMDRLNRKLATVGTGSVGATTAYACLLRGVTRELVLYDIDATSARAQALDLNHGLQFVSHATVEASDDVQICAGADVIVITAGAKQKPGQSRLDLAQANAAICRNLIPKLVT